MSRRSDARRGYRNKDSLRGTGFERFAMGGMPQDHAGKIAPWRRGPRPEARNPDQHIEACISKRMLCGISDRLVVEAVPTQRRAYRQSAEPCEHLVRRIRPFATAEREARRSCGAIQHSDKLVDRLGDQGAVFRKSSRFPNEDDVARGEKLPRQRLQVLGRFAKTPLGA